MKTYTILISETHERTIDIKANSAEDAIEQALVNYQNNDIKTSPENTRIPNLSSTLKKPKTKGNPMSKNFNITITEVLKTTVEVVDAENLEEAIQTVKDQYHDQEIILTADDFTGQVTFEEEQN